ncbi:hypothetical protein [Fulvitalea axinellae]|uniref:hypothetical protein n=1 Tax=Fulvitalea axinellae TaxID=1182444 RepID=UPI0030CA5752
MRYLDNWDISGKGGGGTANGKVMYLSVCILLDLTKCVCCNKSITHYESLHTNGDWLWSGDLNHYLLHHKLFISDEFAEAVQQVPDRRACIEITERFEEFIDNRFSSFSQYLKSGDVKIKVLARCGNENKNWHWVDRNPPYIEGDKPGSERERKHFFIEDKAIDGYKFYAVDYISEDCGEFDKNMRLVYY